MSRAEAMGSMKGMAHCSMIGCDAALANRHTKGSVLSEVSVSGLWVAYLAKQVSNQGSRLK